MASPSPDTLIKPLVACIQGKVPPLPAQIPPSTWPEGIPGLPFVFPEITLPGLPGCLLGALESLFAGINYVLEFLPPDPLELPEIPDISLFIDAFMKSMEGKLPPLPAYSINLEGVDIAIPAIEGVKVPGFPDVPTPGIPGFDPSGILKLIALFIGLPFLIIKGIIDLLVKNLKIELPTLESLEILIGKLGVTLGIPLESMAMISACTASIFMSALSLLG